MVSFETKIILILFEKSRINILPNILFYCFKMKVIQASHSKQGEIEFG